MDRPISTGALTQVQKAVFNGAKIEAIKLYREDTGASLKDAKEAVEKLEAEWRVTSPEKFRAPQGKGCGISAAFLIAIGLALALLFLLTYRSGKVILERESGERPARVQK